MSEFIWAELLFWALVVEAGVFVGLTLRAGTRPTVEPHRAPYAREVACVCKGKRCRS